MAGGVASLGEPGAAVVGACVLRLRCRLEHAFGTAVMWGLESLQQDVSAGGDTFGNALVRSHLEELCFVSI